MLGQIFGTAYLFGVIGLIVYWVGELPDWTLYIIFSLFLIPIFLIIIVIIINIIPIEEKKEYSKKDLIRKETTRLIIWFFSLFMIILGTLCYAKVSNLGGIVLASIGLLYSAMLNNAYEKLLKENIKIKMKGGKNKWKQNQDTK